MSKAGWVRRELDKLNEIVQIAGDKEPLSIVLQIVEYFSEIFFAFNFASFRGGLVS